MSESEEEEYVVEAIREWRYNKKKKRKEYYVKWQDYDEKENTWEPSSNLNCPAILKKFEDNIPPDERQFYFSKHLDSLDGFQRHAKLTALAGADESSQKDEFYLLLKFEDDETADEFTIEDLYRSDPETLLKFFEKRIFVKGE